MANEEKSLAVINYEALGLTVQQAKEYELEMAKQAQEMTHGVDLRRLLPTIKLPMAGGAIFEISDQEAGTRTMKIIIAAVHKVRAYYHPKGHPAQDDENKMPICGSMNLLDGSAPEILACDDQFYVEKLTRLINPKTKMFGRCSQCVLNQFGTAVQETGEVSGGKACKDKVRLYCFTEQKFMEDNNIPYLLTLPVTSIKNWDNYVGKLMNMKAAPGQVLTEVSLSVIEQGKQKYAVCNFGIAADLRKSNPILSYKVSEWRKQYADQLISIALNVEEAGVDAQEPLPF